MKVSIWCDDESEDTHIRFKGMDLVQARDDITIDGYTRSSLLEIVLPIAIGKFEYSSEFTRHTLDPFIEEREKLVKPEGEYAVIIGERRNSTGARIPFVRFTKRSPVEVMDWADVGPKFPKA